VARDIQRAGQPLKPAQFDSKRIRQLIRKKDRVALEAVFGNFPKTSSLHGVKVIDPDFPADHRKARDRRGRVRKFQRVVTPDADQVRECQDAVIGGGGGTDSRPSMGPFRSTRRYWA
jgi:hypothetical protein